MIYAERIVPRVLTALTVGIILTFLVIHEAKQSKEKRDVSTVPQEDVFTIISRKIASVFTGGATANQTNDRKRRSVPLSTPQAEDNLGSEVPRNTSAPDITTKPHTGNGHSGVVNAHSGCSNPNGCGYGLEILILAVLTVVALVIGGVILNWMINRRRRYRAPYRWLTGADDDVLSFTSLVRQHSKQLRRMSPTSFNGLQRQTSATPLLQEEDTNTRKPAALSTDSPPATPHAQEHALIAAHVTYAVAGVQPLSQNNSLETLVPNPHPAARVQPQQDR